MKINSILKLLFAASLFLVIGCESDPLVEKAEDNLFDAKGATVNALDISGSEYNIADVDKTPITFDLISLGETVNSVNMYVALNGGDRQLVSAVSSFPSTQSLNITEAAAAAGVSEDSLVPGDVFTISFDEVSAGSGTYRSGVQFDVLVVTIFKSALAGVFDCVTTVTSQGAGIGWDDCDGSIWEGTVEWVRLQTDPNADGMYQVLTTAASGEQFDDISHGSYYGCYGVDAQGDMANADATFEDGDLIISDVDGIITIPGTSQWDEVWSITGLSVDGANLTLSLSNDYGEGGTSVLTRTDDAEWPADLSN